MLITIDEAGCSGFKFRAGSSRYFVIGSVVIPPSSIEPINHQIDILKTTISPEFREFHFAKNGHRTRVKFLNLIATLDLKMYVFIVPKYLLKGEGFRSKESFYKCLFGYALNNFKSHLQSATVLLDRCSGTSFENEVANNLQRKFPQTDIKHSAAVNQNTLQIADYAASTLFQYYESQHSEKQRRAQAYYEIIAPRVAHIQVWPKPKV